MDIDNSVESVSVPQSPMPVSETVFLVVLRGEQTPIAGIVSDPATVEVSANEGNEEGTEEAEAAIETWADDTSDFLDGMHESSYD